MRAIHPDNSLSHLGTELVSTTEHTLTDRGYFARPGETTRGINESGLAFTCAMVFEDESIKRTRDSTNYADLTEKMMKSCQTVDEAIDLFQSAWGYSICNHGTRSQESYPKEDLPWGTVSAEILQPSQKTFWYAYGWPCGQKPEYGDQIYQEKSWGKFIPFIFSSQAKKETGVSKLTTPEGEITKPGLRYQKKFPG